MLGGSSVLDCLQMLKKQRSLYIHTYTPSGNLTWHKHLKLVEACVAQSKDQPTLTRKRTTTVFVQGGQNDQCLHWQLLWL